MGHLAGRLLGCLLALALTSWASGGSSSFAAADPESSGPERWGAIQPLSAAPVVASDRPTIRPQPKGSRALLAPEVSGLHLGAEGVLASTISILLPQAPVSPIALNLAGRAPPPSSGA